MENKFVLKHITTFENGKCVAIGMIYNDGKQRFEDGSEICTSVIKCINFETNVLQTKNTTYNLIKENK